MVKMNEDKKNFLISQISGATQVSPSNIAESIWMADGESTLGQMVKDIVPEQSEGKCATTLDALKEIRGFLKAHLSEVLEEFDSIVNAVKNN